MRYMIGLLSLCLGLAIGLNVPDFDTKVHFLVHRSIVTHGFLLPILLYSFIPSTEEKPIIRSLSMGFSLSIVVHLCFDLFPRAWRGFALISIPFYGRSSALFSWLWIAGSIILCLYLVFLLIENLWDLIIVGGGTVSSFNICAATENVFWAALLTLIGATVVTLMLPSNSNKLIKRYVLRQGVN